MDWLKEYKRKLVSAEEAVRVVKSGDKVVVASHGADPVALQAALAARKNELRAVEILTWSRGSYGWFDPGAEDSFRVTVMGALGSAVRSMVSAKRNDFFPNIFPLWHKAEDEGRTRRAGIDVVMVVVSPPDKNGFCSFGCHIGDKRSLTRRARKVLAEVNDSPPMRLRTYGENFIHVSEIECFVENTVPISAEFEAFSPPGDDEKRIAQYVSNLIKDGDTIELGTGASTMCLPDLGIFGDKHDLGLHSGMSTLRILRLMKEGIFNGKRRNIHTGKAVLAMCPTDEESLEFVNENPAVEFYDFEYLHDPVKVALNDNMVAINGAIGVDLSGQIAGESIGLRVFSQVGGQPGFALGAVLSKGGRSITVLPSTAAKGTKSRIVPLFEPGTAVTIPRYFADYIVTEFGVASLLGKSLRERVEELIAIAHPDFRAELRKEAERLY